VSRAGLGSRTPDSERIQTRHHREPYSEYDYLLALRVRHLDHDDPIDELLVSCDLCRRRRQATFPDHLGHLDHLDKYSRALFLRGY
jgi:hypothetical protein